MSDWDEVFSDALADLRDDFGVPVVYTPNGGGDISLTAIFGERSEEETFLSGDARSLEGSYPLATIDIILSDLGATPVKGDQVLVVASGLTWTVQHVPPITGENVVLRLKR